MNYDVIGDDHNVGSSMTIGELIDLLEASPFSFTYFIDTAYGIGNLHSWRGTYCEPAISYEVHTLKNKDVAKQLKISLNKTHSGWKGGEYTFYKDQVFYVAREGSSEEYQVIDARKDEFDNIVLITKKISW